jgi:LPS sulfotransferase NodH
VSTHEESALRILDYLGVPASQPVTFAPRSLQQLADAVSDEWVPRYHERKTTSARPRAQGTAEGGFGD